MRKVDFEKEKRSLRGRYLAEKAEIEEAYRRAKSQARIRSNPEELRKHHQRMLDDLAAARERFKAEMDRVLPRSAGAGR